MTDTTLHLQEQTIPPKGMPRSVVDPLTEKHKKAPRQYAETIETFESSTMISALVTCGDLPPGTVAAGLNSAIRRLDRAASIRTVCRGADVYLARRSDDPGVLNRLLNETLDLFACSRKAEKVVKLPEGTDTTKAYHSLHYRRTRLGYGDIVVVMRGGKILLQKRVDT